MLVRLVAFAASVSALVACSSTTTVSSPSASPAPAKLQLTYLGVAGWQLADGEHVLLVDPYFSRVDPPDGRSVIAPDLRVIDEHTPPRADAILVTHSHYDHVLDVPTIATRTGATVIGTESTANVARAGGVADDHLRIANPAAPIVIGPFDVRPIRALHSLTGQAYAEIPRAITLPMAADAYGEGGTLQYLVRVEGRSILFIGTANFIESELRDVHPDVAVIATGLREKIPDYACRLMRVLGHPRLVLTNHFDAHRAPLGPKQVDSSEEGKANLAQFADEVHACSPTTVVVVPTHFRTISF